MSTRKSPSSRWRTNVKPEFLEWLPSAQLPREGMACLVYNTAFKRYHIASRKGKVWVERGGKNRPMLVTDMWVPMIHLKPYLVDETNEGLRRISGGDESDSDGWLDGGWESDEIV